MGGLLKGPATLERSWEALGGTGRGTDWDGGGGGGQRQPANASENFQKKLKKLKNSENFPNFSKKISKKQFPKKGGFAGSHAKLRGARQHLLAPVMLREEQISRRSPPKPQVHPHSSGGGDMGPGTHATSAHQRIWIFAFAHLMEDSRHGSPPPHTPPPQRPPPDPLEAWGRGGGLCDGAAGEATTNDDWWITGPRSDPPPGTSGVTDYRACRPQTHPHCLEPEPRLQ